MGYVNFILEEIFALKSYVKIQQTIEKTSKPNKILTIKVSTCLFSILKTCPKSTTYIITYLLKQQVLCNEKFTSYL